MKLVKMDRRYSLYHQGFTHQLKYFGLEERRNLERFFTERYGANREYGEHWSDGYTMNRNWRIENKDSSGKRRWRIYVKHEQDLVLLGLKYGLKIER